ncbi:MAG: hypothetical protein GY719_40785 [bacterium]|nr:hypothetical protein [bacterium]
MSPDPECPKDRDARWRRPPASEVPEVSEQLALIVGLAASAVPKLDNAAHDAESLGRLLREDFGFELLPAGKPLLEENAVIDTIRRCVEESLGDGTSATRWLFYFAGHGTVVGDQGFLVPAGADVKDPEQLLSLRWLVERALKSRCGQVLIVLDACHAGRALLRPKVDPWLNPDAPEDFGTVQVLAASGPYQKVVDGYGEGHSVFTQCLLEALDGRAGVHDDDGAIRFTPLSEHLAGEVERRLKEARVPDRQQLFGVTVRFGSAGHLHGEFRFQPRWPRLPPDLVQGLQPGDPRRLASLKKLAENFLANPRELLEAERLRWNLPLALHLALRGLPRTPLEDGWRTETPSAEPDWEVRQQQSRALGVLGRLDRAGNSDYGIADALLHLAVRDRDAAVRQAARKSLGRLLKRAEQTRLGRCLEALRGESARVLRRRLRHAQAQLPEYRRELRPLRRAGALFTRVALVAGVGWRGIARVRWRRRLALGFAVVALAVYVVTATGYYLGAGPRSEVMVYWGLPGLEGLPGLGKSVVVTDYSLRDLSNSAVVTQKRVVGTWLLPRDGAFGWGRQLAAELQPAEAALAWWRLGDLDRALNATRAAITATDRDGVRAAAYLAFQSGDAFESVLEQLLAALDVETNSVRDEALRALEILRQARPEETTTALQRLASRLESSPEPALIEAVSALGGETAGVVTALRSALALLEKDPDARTGRRLEAAAQRLLEAHPELTAEHLDDILRLSLQGAEGRRTLLDAAASSATSPGERRRTAAVLLHLLEEPGEPGRLSALGLLSPLLDGDSELIAQSAPVLVSLSGDSDPEIVLAAAGVVATLPAELLPGRNAFLDRLQEILRREARSKLRTRAIERLAALSGERTDQDVGRALLEAVEDDDTDVRGQALQSLVELALARRVDVTLLEPVLGTALRDRSPWVRQEAVVGALLLTDHLDALFEEAFALALAEIVSSQNAWQAAEGWGRTFARATPQAAERFGLRLLRELAAGNGDRQVLLRCFEQLVQSQPVVLSDLAPGLTFLFAAEEGLAADVRWRLNALRDAGIDLKPLGELFLVQLGSSSPLDRQAAAFALGVLAAGDSDLERRALSALRRAQADPDPVMRARIAGSLEALGRREQISGRVAELILSGLGDSHPEVRRSFARVLAEAAERVSLPMPLPPVLRAALADPSPAIRRYAARALALEARRGTSALAAEEDWLRERLIGEKDIPVRLRLGAALGAIAGEDPAPVEELTVLAGMALASGEEEQQLAAFSALRILAQARPNAARSVAWTLRGALPLSTPSLDRLVVLTLRDLGMAHPENGRVAVEALTSILLEVDDDRLHWHVIANGLRPLARLEPVLAPHVLQELERFLRRDTRRGDEQANPLHPRNRLLSEASSTWVEMMVAPAVEDPGILWQRMGSPERGDRHAALQVLELLVVDHPALVPELQADLEQRRRSWQPHVRMAATRALESIAILDKTCSRLDDPEAFERWQDVLRWLSDAPLRINVHEAVSRAQERR